MTARFNPYRRFVGSHIPNWLLERQELSAGAKLTYARLAQHGWGSGFAKPKLDTLAQEIGTSKRQLCRYLDELRQLNLIVVERPGMGRANRYYFLEHAWMSTTVATQELPDMAIQELPSMATQELPDMAIPMKGISRKESTGRNIPSPIGDGPAPLVHGASVEGSLLQEASTGGNASARKAITGGNAENVAVAEVFEALAQRRKWQPTKSDRAREAKAIREMLRAGHTPGDIAATYDALKAAPFWHDKALMAWHLTGAVGEHKHGTLGGNKGRLIDDSLNLY